MAYLGMCTMDMVEYVNPLTGETTYGSSSCPPEGFVRVDEVDAKKTGFYRPTPMTLPTQESLVRPIQMTPQQIEAQVKQIQPAQGGGLALAAIAAYLIMGA
jgi:hypothetical protein